MSVRNQLKLLLGGLNARRADESAPGHRTPASSGNNAAHSATRDFLDRNGLVSAAIFVFTVVAIVLISWAGMTTSNFAVLPDQLATVRVTANAAFAYESAEKTRAERANSSTASRPSTASKPSRSAVSNSPPALSSRNSTSTRPLILPPIPRPTARPFPHRAHHSRRPLRPHLSTSSPSARPNSPPSPNPSTSAAPTMQPSRISRPSSPLATPSPAPFCSKTASPPSAIFTPRA